MHDTAEGTDVQTAWALLQLSHRLHPLSCLLEALTALGNLSVWVVTSVLRTENRVDALRNAFGALGACLDQESVTYGACNTKECPHEDLD